MAEHELLRTENEALRERVRHLELQLAEPQQTPAAEQTPASVGAAPPVSPSIQSDRAWNRNAQGVAPSHADDASSPALPALSTAARESGGMEQEEGNGTAAGGSWLGGAQQAPAPLQWSSAPHGLSQEQVGRYSRQLMLPSFGVEAQARLCASSVLIVGAGGLGCPAALYLAAAGVGRLGLLDRDGVALSNLHRQIAHTEARVGVHKAESAAAACRALNSSIEVVVHYEALAPANALRLVGGYDIVVDATDNAPTRYLVSDACVAAGRPLVSGAALGTDGQLTVYNHGADGPCYRCLFPEAPRPQSCARCSDAGVLGVVPGIIGCLQGAMSLRVPGSAQALEAIKLAAGVGSPLSRKLLLLDALSGRIHTVKLRGRAESCISCGPAASITAANLASYDYSAFTSQLSADDKPPPALRLLPAEQRATAAELAVTLLSQRSRLGTLILDVRPEEQFAIGHLAGSVNVPFDSFERRQPEVLRLCADAAAAGGSLVTPLVVVCRRGNDSQEAVQQLQGWGFTAAVDLVDGLQAWHRDVDATFPCY